MARRTEHGNFMMIGNTMEVSGRTVWINEL